MLFLPSRSSYWVAYLTTDLVSGQQGMHIGCVGEPLSLLCLTLPKACSETLHRDSHRHILALCDLPFAKVQDHQQGKPLLFFSREGAITDDDLWC
jgi:hypothetical protein